MNQKFFLKSMGIWGGLIAGIPPLLNILGVTPSPDDIAALDELVRTFADNAWAFANQVNVFLGSALAIWGRFKAKSQLVLKPVKKS